MSNQSVTEFQAPPPPPAPKTEGPVMSTAQTLTSIFFEPGETFESLRIRPRFLIAFIITILLFMAYYVTFVTRVGAENIVRAQIESRSPDATPEQIEQQLAIQRNPVVKALTYASFPVVFAVIFAGGAGLYLLGTMMMAKSMTYKQSLSVWTYSSYPPMVVFAVINLILVFLKAPEDLDANALNTGLARANLSLLVSPKEQPILATLLGSLDLIAFYGLFLGALGLRKVAKLSSGSAWAIVLMIWVLGVIIRVAMAAIFGTAM